MSQELPEEVQSVFQHWREEGSMRVRDLVLSTYEKGIAAGRASMKEEAAKVADAHKGSAAAKISSTRWKQMDDELKETIRSEERGEDIASEMIAAAIRALP